MPPVFGAELSKAFVSVRSPGQIALSAHDGVVSSKGLVGRVAQRCAAPVAIHLLADLHVKRRLLRPLAYELLVFRLRIQVLGPRRGVVAFAPAAMPEIFAPAESDSCE